MTSVTVEQLFDSHRFPTGGLELAAVVIYFPVGLALAVLRLFIGLHIYLVAWLLPKTSVLRRFVLRVMCSVLGILVFQEQSENRDHYARVLVANYSSTMDRLAVEILYPNDMPSMWDLPSSLMWLLGYKDLGARHGRETLIQNGKKHCRDSNIPLLAFPEGATTSGKVGLLKFSVWPFSLDQPIQPVLIRIVRPSLAALKPSVVNSWWWTDLFWFLFVPYSCFHIRLLPVETQSEDETVQEFAARVQRLMAKSLGIEATSYTSADKIDHIKREQTTAHYSQLKPIALAASSSSSSSVTSELEMMANQVKNVLPHVPHHIIQQDLSLTKDVDLTITNLLEGRVEFVACEPAVEADRGSSPPPQTPNQPTKPSTQQTTSFGRTPAERQMTFAERKKVLLDNARRRYIEKHNLTGIAQPSENTS